ncbi:MAG: PKD domain-containing protein [Armatimonadota bacterium]
MRCPLMAAAASVVIMIAGCASFAAANRTLYLAPGGADDNPGTLELPWATLEHAATQVGPGDTLVLAAGEHGGVFAPERGGEGAEAPLTVRAQQRRQAVLTGAPGQFAVSLQGLAHVRLEGLTIRTTNAPGGRWLRVDGCEHIVVDDMRMEDTDASLGLHITASSDVTLRACELRLARSGSMARIEGSQRVTIAGCAFTRGGHDVLLLWPDRTNRQFVLRGNVFHPTTCRGPLVDSVERILFEDNVITRMFDGGRCAGANFQFFASDSIFRFNRVYDNWGEHLWWLSTYRETLDFQGIRAYHNVFDDNSSIALRMLKANRYGTAANSRFINNVFARNDPYGSHRDLQISEGDADQVRFVGNLLTGAAEVDEQSVGLGDLERAGEMFVRNLTGDPGFADATAHDHAPGADSPMRDGGAPLTHVVGTGTGSTLTVADARCFYDGFGIAGEVGDTIVVGPERLRAVVLRADLEASTLVLDRELSWRDGDPVSLPFDGAAPELGVYQEGAAARPTVQIIAEPHRPRPGDAVRLRAVVHGAIEPTEAIWHLGDGSIAGGLELEHRFADPYDYPVRVEVRTAGGQSRWGATCLVVEEPRDPAAPLVHSTFGPEDDEAWFRWQCYRPGQTAFEVVDDGVTGGRCTYTPPRMAAPSLPGRTLGSGRSTATR